TPPARIPCSSHSFTPRPLLSFYSYRDHRALHSFPTRRSSDLMLTIAGLFSFHTAKVQNFPDVDLPMITVVASLPGTAPAQMETEDRKSTRLNSSHVKISYAVFCLKKKTKKTHLAYTAANSISV